MSSRENWHDSLGESLSQSTLNLVADQTRILPPNVGPPQLVVSAPLLAGRATPPVRMVVCVPGSEVANSPLLLRIEPNGASRCRITRKTDLQLSSAKLNDNDILIGPQAGR